MASARREGGVVVTCPICGSEEFIAFGGRPCGRCDGCDSLERQRALALMATATFAQGRGRSCLEAGPLNAKVFGQFLRDHGWSYTAVDRSRSGNPHDPRSVGFIDVEADLSDLGAFADASFDLFLSQHVMEEVHNYQDALSEIARVLKPGGLALMEIPFDADRAGTQAKEPDRFGKVWRFGTDLTDEVRARFTRVELLPLRDGDYRASLMACER
jgi:SAM-dependent methyltransferase